MPWGNLSTSSPFWEKSKWYYNKIHVIYMGYAYNTWSFGMQTMIRLVHGCFRIVSRDTLDAYYL